MVKGFVTAASLSSEDIGAVDKSVSELWCSALGPVRKRLTPLTNDPQYALRKKAQLAALGEWTHINGLQRGSRDRVQDEILQKLMYDFGPEQPQASSSDVLLANDSASTAFSSASIEVPVGRVPGGTISFIFERFSTTIEKENDGGPGDDSSS